MSSNLTQIAMGSPLGAANYIFFAVAWLKPKTLGNTGPNSRGICTNCGGHSKRISNDRRVCKIIAQIQLEDPKF